MLEENDIKKENKDPEEKSIESIPQYLKHLRHKRGVSIEDAASFLKINTEYLRAYENGGFDELPEEAYAKIFLKTYTNYLGGDSKLVLTKFNQMLAEKKQKKELVEENKFKKEIPPQLKDLWKRGSQNYRMNFLIAIIILIIIFVWFLYGRKRNGKLNEDLSFQEEILPRETADSKKRDEKNSVKPGWEKTTVERPVNRKEDKVILKANASDTVNVELVIDGKIIVKEIMKKGETRTWMADKGFVINTDNAGALDFTFNSERFGVLGELGQPKEGINFPPQKKE